MKISLAQSSKIPEPFHCLVIGLSRKNSYRKHPFISLISKDDRVFVDRILASEKTWDEKKVLIIPLPSNPTRKLVFLGLKEKKLWNHRIRQFALRKIIFIAKEAHLSKIAFFLNDFPFPENDQVTAVRTAVENLLLADFIFNKYKKEPKEGWPKIDTLTILTSDVNISLTKALKEGLIIGNAVNRCRILANTPGGEMTPQKLAEAAMKEGEKIKTLKVKVLNERDIEQLGMGGIIGVSRGSTEKPRFIVIEYWGAKRKYIKQKAKNTDAAVEKPLVFVGKGVTFDSGGLNLKPSDGIYEMHLDMSGGAAVLCALSAISQLKLPVNVVGLIPAVENMPSGSSYHPGDILRTITGKTIEVLNTDAEGRIILADALGYAQRYKPRLIVDLATLTGAAMIALGQRVTALFTQDKKLEMLARSVGERSGDEVWPLPLWDDYAEDIQGTFGDVANVGKTRYGGAITGAIFLKQFVGDSPWIHLDIAPTMTSIDGQNLAKGAIGTGVRFLVELSRHYIK